MNTTVQTPIMMFRTERTERHGSRYCMKNEGENWICPRDQSHLVGLVRVECVVPCI